MATLSKVREELSQQFIAALGQGQLPWSACWSQDRPLNAVTGKLYRGVNALMLSWCAEDRGHTDPRWCTYYQAQEKGWQVRKGARGARVEYWAYYDLKEKKLLGWDEVRRLLRADPDYKQNLQLRWRCYTVFNGEQVEGIPELARQRQTDIGTLRAQRDRLIQNMGIQYRELGQEAYYSPASDTVTLPPEASFDDTYSYMATFLHECGHATGHPNRLARDLSGDFGSESYAREELRAEIASAFTAQSIGLQLTDAQQQFQTQRHAAYLQHWASILKDAPEELFRAIRDAEGISDYLLEQGEFGNDREVISGKTDGIDYTLIPLPEGDGVELAFSGRGELPGFTGEAQRPWQAQAAAIRAVTVGRSITGVGPKVMSGLPALERVSWPGGTRGLGGQELEKCAALQEVHIIANGQPIHSPQELLQASERFPGLTVEQLSEVAEGFREGLSQEQVALYAKPEFDPGQMSAICYSWATGRTPEQMALIANPALAPLQMDVIRCGFESGLTMAEVSSYAKPELPAVQMLDICRDIKDARGEDMRQMLSAEKEFWEMDAFLKNGGDIAELADLYERDLDMEL